MNALQNIAPALTMSSREIAELTSKDLGHVNRDIRAMLDSLGDDPELEHVREDKDARGYTVAFHLGRELTYTLLAGYSTQLRRRVIARWQELEAAQAKTPAELSRMDILRLAMESEQARIQAESERDKAIATKAEIGSRREATAMATASAKSREVARLQLEAQVKGAALSERERICAAIKAEDDYCVTQGDYMLDSDDCIKVARGEWERPVYEVEAAAKTGDTA